MLSDTPSPRLPARLTHGLGRLIATSALLTSVVIVVLAVSADAADHLPAPVPTPAGSSPSNGSFEIATFNILGSQHTLGRSGWGPGKSRARISARLIDRRGLDIVGLQEVQDDQLRVLTNRLDRYTVWPGRTLGGGGMRLQIAFRTSEFDLLDTGRIVTAFDRQRRPIPYVLLHHRATGRKLYVVDVHNSAGNLEQERDSATRRQVRLVKQLRETGRSVFVLGDMNEKEEWFCTVVGSTDLVAANGGRVSRDTCDPPEGYLPIDWIMGSGPMQFSNYRWDESRAVRLASDHRLVRATVTMRPRSR